MGLLCAVRPSRDHRFTLTDVPLFIVVAPLYKLNTVARQRFSTIKSVCATQCCVELSTALVHLGLHFYKVNACEGRHTYQSKTRGGGDLLLYHFERHRTSRDSCNALDSVFGRCSLRISGGHRLSWLMFPVSPQSLQANAGINRPQPCPSKSFLIYGQFIIRRYIGLVRRKTNPTNMERGLCRQPRGAEGLLDLNSIFYKERELTSLRPCSGKTEAKVEPLYTRGQSA
jgi:hypothetical protein